MTQHFNLLFQKKGTKIESRQIVSQDGIKKIILLNESVKGTREYMKYHMEMSYKHDSTKKGSEVYE